MLKTIPLLVGLSVLSVVVTSPMPASSEKPDKDAITQAVLTVHRDMNQADSQLDVDLLFQHIVDANGCSIIQDGRLFPSRDIAYRVVRQGFQRVGAITRSFESPQVTVLSAASALLVTQGHVRTVLKDGRVFESPFALSALYVHKGGRWQMLHGHYSAPNPQ